ncbi:MAG: BrnT family toxin [Acidobacteria bacterium]|nr:BrnT family toxin [Acidobacteriota bacterium]
MATHRDPLASCTGFDWDEANTGKNWDRHRVTPEEAEDVFFNQPLIIRSDLAHSGREKRYFALGQTGTGRRLFVAFTIRRDRIRVISTRDMNRKENKAYAQHEEAST